MFAKILLIFCLIVNTFCVQNNLESVLKKNAIIPDVIDTVPKDLIKVHYSNETKVNLGNEVKPHAVKAQPSVDWPTENGTYYTLMMVDPDAPSRKQPTMRSIKHWLIVNIPENEVTKGDILAGYIGPAPPKDSGLHRYILIVYKQNGTIHPDKRDDSISARVSFKNKAFAQKFKLGQPVAVNFFQAQYEETNKLESILKENEIIPEFIQTAPKSLIKVDYSNVTEVNFGNELKPSSVKAQPSVIWPIENSTFYTLMMIDPDAPSRKQPTRRSIKHWLIVNIPENEVTKGDILAGYIGPGPPKGSGLHRYIFIVYKQSGKITSEKRNDEHTARVSFNNKVFAQKHKLGQPVAVNFFQSQYEGN